MGLKKFHEYASSLDANDTKQEVVKESKSKNSGKVIKQKSFNKKVIKPKKVNEASFLVGQDYKVKSTFDVSQQLVQQYIEKVTEETGKNPLDNFNEAEIAEQMIDYVVKQNMLIDNLPSDFTVGTEPTSDMENADDLAQADSEDLNADMGEADEEFDMEGDSNIVPEVETETENEDDNATGDIEFDLEESDIDEEIEVETEDMTEDEAEDEAETEEGGFEEIEFDEKEEAETEEGSKKPKTIGDYLNKKKESESDSEEEEEEEISEVEDLYKKVGYKTGYFESLNMNNLYNPLK
jgi:hypothetical protein